MFKYLNIYRFLESTEVLPVLRMLEWDELVGFARSKLPICNNYSVFFFFFHCGQDNLLGGRVWAMGRFMGQSNLLGGQMPT